MLEQVWIDERPLGLLGPAPEASPVPRVFFRSARFVSGSIDGPQVTVPLGSFVDVYVTLSAPAPVKGTLEVEIRKDIPSAADETKQICSSSLDLGTAEREIGGCVFLADQLTGDSLQQYYLQVRWNGTVIYDPSNADTREYVLTEVLVLPVPAVSVSQEEFNTIQQAVYALMVDNNISTIPNPVSANTAPCTTGTQDLTAYPDTTSDDGVGGGGDGGKGNDPSGVAYDFDGVGTDDAQGYLLFGHDITAEGTTTPVVNYVSFDQTTFCYTADSDGTVHQYDEAGTELR